LRPRTESRTPASTATSTAASATVVSRTSRTCGSSKVGRRSGYATNSASVAPSRPKSRTSPQSQDWYAFSSFRISLYSAEPIQPIRAARPMATRVLIVDDHPLTREALAGLLTQHDFSVVGQAADGEQAVEVARRSEEHTSELQSPYDLVC